MARWGHAPFIVFASWLPLACSGGGGGTASGGTEGTAGGTAAETGAPQTAGTESQGGGATEASGTRGTATAGGSAGTTAGSGGATDSASAGTGGTTGGGGVCARWNADRADLSEGTWTGDLAACDPGDVTPPGRDNALKLVNLYRFLAGLPPVQTAPVRDAKAQACALMMDANGMLSHSPPMSWACYSAEGAEAAGKSNIASTSGVAAVDLYMVDPGNPTTLGHRRWILSNTLGPIGLGSTTGASCMWVIGGGGNAGAPYTAWPPEGTFPLQAVAPIWTGIDETGWSIQSDTIDLSGAQVTVTRDGMPLPVSVSQLAGGYGSTYAISMIPQGWTTAVGIYHVEVSGVDPPIAYDVEVVDCGG